MPATGDGRAPGAASLSGTHHGAPVGHARNRPHATGSATTAPPIPHPRPRTGNLPAAADAPAAGGTAPLKLLVIEDDASDAQLIKAAVADSGTSIEIHWARGLEQAGELLAVPSHGPRRGRSRGSEFSCVLLDLAAPADLPHPSDDSDGLEGLHELLRRAPHTAVVVLTDAAGAELGAAAVAAGAQDFLIKHETDGPLLARALRYAVERKRADESQRRLVEAELRGQENARLQRHLLPTPLLDGAGLSFTRRYRPGRRRALLGGDFYDAVRTDDGTVHVVIGDVCGHGPDEAALGVALRIAWRTLVFAGLTGETLLTTLQHVLEHERRSDEIFATLCMLVIEPGGASGDLGSLGAGEQARLYLAGHPAPLLLGRDHPPVTLPADLAGPALGLLPCYDGQAAWPAHQLELQPGWRLLLYTDGLIEGRVGAGSRRLGQDGLADLIGDHQSAGLTRGRLVDSAIAEVEELNGGALTDDVAVLLLERNPVQLILG
ncbi:serine phosphatase RsbU (regulator of sigma subunit) [Kitasatospora sp. MAA19]|uniref:PP2C family protein-serine/threonine phosphatase n=1 Tax=Kitasatospora sp. MAA19 TaxID=3035090 RepID=UPI0024770D0B|nr:SpoIIE family protein phosphatase [Kitasatospora sp. MAA19]MDH6704836.1 serine phosphatase RsbU (regulator of sigma subunit) [Kitasatospora sp. MAA19]